MRGPGPGVGVEKERGGSKPSGGSGIGPAVVLVAVLLGLPGRVEAQRTGRQATGTPIPGSGLGGDAATVALPRLPGPVVLDGVPDEAAWEALAPLPMVQHWPTYRGAMSRETQIRVAYDDEYLWASGRFYDDPDGVRARSLQRDRWDGDDTFDLVIDSFNDDQTALRFTTTPLGILLDSEVLNDAQWSGGVQALNDSWNTFWDAEATRTEEGWFAEIRIPLASLGFDAEDGEAVMGIIASRTIARTNEKHIFPAIPPDWDMAEFKPSQARDVSLDGVEEQAPLWVTPYALAGLDRTRVPSAEPLRPPETQLSREVGVDVKYGLSSNLTLDLTVNTDFAQVESDALAVNLDRFGLFFPEKRQFFQERSSTFQFALGEDNRLFHSRRIGLSEDGRPLTIYGGARVAGRVGDWDVGALSLQVAGGEGAPDENAGAVRLRRSMLGTGRVGGMVTSRVRTDGGADLSFGVDGEVPWGEDRVTIQLAHTRNEASPVASPLQRSSARVFWERRTLQGLGYDASLQWSGSGYEPRLGFEARNDFTAFQGRVAWVWEPEGSGRVDRARLQAVTRTFWRNGDGSVESWLGRAQFLADLSGGHWFNVTVNVTRERVAEAFELPGAAVGRGVYWGADLFTRFEASRARALTAAGTLWTGRAFDGWRLRFDLWSQLTLSRHLTVSARYDLHRLWFPQRDQRVNADLAVVRLQAALDAKLSAELFVQRSAASRAVSVNGRLRYRFAEGRDLFLVVDEARDLDDRFGVDSAVLGRTDRRLLLKYAWAFRP